MTRQHTRPGRSVCALYLVGIVMLSLLASTGAAGAVEGASAATNTCSLPDDCWTLHDADPTPEPDDGPTDGVPDVPTAIDEIADLWKHILAEVVADA